MSAVRPITAYTIVVLTEGCTHATNTCERCPSFQGHFFVPAKPYSSDSQPNPTHHCPLTLSALATLLPQDRTTTHPVG
jgi:hypothetical protein